ncbi:platelet-activating factor acetylhydrolase [Myxozyma melibiosi]|uniref:Putative phospholipase n=1 Tax=Myxozyma melibiosi TaxID=54550 RepID=A0ABR1F532_9ASCO
MIGSAAKYLTPKLPPYPGPYTVGSVEVEVPAPWPAKYDAIGTAVETLLFRVFYPGSVTADGAAEVHPYWFPGGNRDYIKDYVQFLGKSSTIGSLLARVPFVADAVLPCLANIPLLAPPSGHKWPVIVFSHGLGGTRNAYSQFCGSMASHGAIVIAPEHRDMSAPITYVRNYKDNTYSEIPYRRMMEVNETARILRTFQLTQRVREVVSIVKVLLEQKIDLTPASTVNSREPVSINPINFNWDFVDTTIEKVLYSGHSFGAATTIAVVKGVHHLLDFLFQKPTDAVATNNTGNEEVPDSIDQEYDPNDQFLRPHPSAGVVLLDPWLIPVYQMMGIPLTVPAVANMSQSFYGWKSNMNLVYQLLSNSAVPEKIRPKTDTGVHLFLTKPSVHHSQSDFALLFPSLTKYAFKLPECTFETQTAVMNMNVAGCVEFLREYAGVQLFDVTGDADEGLVRTESKEHEEGSTETVSTGYLVAGGQIKGWSRLDVENDITVVDILEGNT